jgi:cytochrome c1
MRFAHTLLALVASLTLSLAAQASTPAAAPSATPAPAAAPKTVTSTADHSKFKELQQNFKSGPEVTKACLSCHTEASKQLHKTKHWTWEFINTEKNQKLGKKNVLNNFCISGNNMQDKGCMSCHPGWGSETEAVNCLNCHGQKAINWEESFDDLDAFDGFTAPRNLADTTIAAAPGDGAVSLRITRSLADDTTPPHACR